MIPIENSIEMAEVSKQELKVAKSEEDLNGDNKHKSLTPSNLDLKKLSNFNSSARNFMEATATKKVDDARSLTEEDQYLPEDIQIEQ